LEMWKDLEGYLYGARGNFGAESFLDLASVYSAWGDDRVIEVCKEGLDRFPDDQGKFQRQLTLAHVALGNYEASIESCWTEVHSCYAVVNSFESSSIKLGICLHDRGDNFSTFTDLMAMYHSTGRAESILSDLENAIERYPFRMTMLWQVFESICIVNGESERLERCDRIVSDRDGEPWGWDLERRQAQRYQSRGEFAAALEVYQRLFDQDPHRNDGVLELLVGTYLQMGRPEDAIKVCSAAASSSTPEQHWRTLRVVEEAYLATGDLLARIKHYEECFQNYVGHSNHVTDAGILLCQSHIAKGEYDEAVEVHEKMLQAWDFSVTGITGEYDLADLYVAAGHFEAAIRTYENENHMPVRVENARRILFWKGECSGFILVLEKNLLQEICSRST
jgi:hypothetical protein